MDQQGDRVRDDSSLILAITGHDWLLVDELIEEGSDIAATNRQNQTCLAIASGISSCPFELICKLASKESINAPDEDLNTAIYRAIHARRWDVVDYIIHNGANVNHLNKFGSSALMDILKYKEAPMQTVSRLISDFNINFQCYLMKSSALHIACMSCFADAIQLLLSRGADINLVDKVNNTVLMKAVLAVGIPGSASAVDIATMPPTLIAQLVSDQNVNIQDESGNSALHNAVLFQNWAAVDVLCQQGALVNLTNEMHLTPLAMLGKPVYVHSFKLSKDINPVAMSFLPMLTPGDNVQIIIAIVNIVSNFPGVFYYDVIQRLLQSLHAISQPGSWTHNSDNTIAVNSTTIKVGGYVANFWAIYFIEHLISEVFKSTTGKTAGRKENLSHDGSDSNESQVKMKSAGSEFRAVITLQNLCGFTIRGCMPSKSTECFQALGLPRKLLDLVSMKTLTDDLCNMWHQHMLAHRNTWAKIVHW